MKLRVVIEFDPDANAYSAVCPELPDVASCGATEEEALAKFREALELHLEPTPGEVAPGAKVVEIQV